MKIVGADTKVMSRHGDIITYEEHCQRLVAFTEEVKEKALQLTQRNTELSENCIASKFTRWISYYSGGFESNRWFFVGNHHIYG